MIATITKDNLPEIRELLARMVREAFPSVTFTDIWVRGREVWAYGDEADEVVDIWSVYEGDAGQIDPRVRNRFSLSRGGYVTRGGCDRVAGHAVHHQRRRGRLGS